MTAPYSLEKILCLSAPFLLGLLLIFFNQIPFHLMPYYHQSFPFVCCVIFYFAVFNPKVLNVFLVFLLGLISDAITSVPFGFNTFGYVFLFFIANLFQSYLINMVFWQLWCVFAILFFCTDIIWAFLFFLISGIWVSTGFWFVQYLFVCLFYPLFCYVLGILNRRIQEVS